MIASNVLPHELTNQRKQANSSTHDSVEFVPQDYPNLPTVSFSQPHAFLDERIVRMRYGVAHVSIKCFLEHVRQVIKAKQPSVPHQIFHDRVSVRSYRLASLPMPLYQMAER